MSVDLEGIARAQFRISFDDTLPANHLRSFDTNGDARVDRDELLHGLEAAHRNASTRELVQRLELRTRQFTSEHRTLTDRIRRLGVLARVGWIGAATSPGAGGVAFGIGQVLNMSGLVATGIIGVAAILLITFVVIGLLAGVAKDRARNAELECRSTYGDDSAELLAQINTRLASTARGPQAALAAPTGKGVRT